MGVLPKTGNFPISTGQVHRICRISIHYIIFTLIFPFRILLPWDSLISIAGNENP
jgi:hypothetical protein